jgi:hypothetical protein
LKNILGKRIRIGSNFNNLWLYAGVFLRALYTKLPEACSILTCTWFDLLFLHFAEIVKCTLILNYVSMNRPSFRSCFWQMPGCNCFIYSTTTCWIVGKHTSNIWWSQSLGKTPEIFCSLSCNQGRGEYFSYYLCMCVCVCVVRDSQYKALKDWLG